MAARLVAQLSDVDLQHLDRSGTQGPEAFAFEGFAEIVPKGEPAQLHALSAGLG
jgi:hypothetical protein